MAIKRNTIILFSGILTMSVFFGLVIIPAALVSLGYGDNFNFKLLSVTGVVNTEIKCYVKASGFTEKQNLAGTLISQGDAKQSAFYIKNPVTIFGLDILDNEGVKDPITSFKIYPKVRCDIPNKSKAVLEISPTDITLEVFSQNEKKTKVLTHSETKKINSFTLSDNKEITLTEFIVDPFKIEQSLKTTGYNSYQEFRISGNINLNYDKYEGTVYQVAVPKDTVKITFYTAIGTVSNDGVPSIQCPSNKLLKDGICVPKCTSSEILENNQCVPKPEPIQCDSGYELVDNKCIPKQTSGGQSDPKVQSFDLAQNLLADWFTKIIIGDFASLSQVKYVGINVVAAFVIIVIVLSAIAGLKSKPRS